MPATKPNMDELSKALEEAQAAYQAGLKIIKTEENKAKIAEIRTAWEAVTNATPPVQASVDNGDLEAVSASLTGFAKAVSTFTTLVRAGTPRARRPQREGNGNGTRSGGLRDLVLQTLTANPATEYTGNEMAKVLDRSSGACANALEKLAEMGEAVQTSEKPRRFKKAVTEAA